MQTLKIAAIYFSDFVGRIEGSEKTIFHKIVSCNFAAPTGSSFYGFNY